MQKPMTAADGIRAIDTRMGGIERVTSAYLIEASEPTLIETGPALTAAGVATALVELGVGANDLAHVFLTHIHLDHAGGAGDIASAFPKAKVWVHERGAEHLADPERLVASTARVYGDQRMKQLFGSTKPVLQSQLRTASEGQRVGIGGRFLEVFCTPGHASHHLSFADSATGAVFTGDAVGVHLPGLDALRPAAPPPEFDLDLALSSIDTIAERARSALLFSHFGPAADVGAICQMAKERLLEAAELVRLALQRTEDVDAITEELQNQAAGHEATLGPSDLAALDISGDPRLNALGLSRYWKKRTEAEAKAEPRSASR